MSQTAANEAPANVLPDGVTLAPYTMKDGTRIKGRQEVRYQGKTVGSIARGEDGWMAGSSWEIHPTRGEAIRAVLTRHFSQMGALVAHYFRRGKYHAPWFLRDKIVDLEDIPERNMDQEANLEGYRRALLTLESRAFAGQPVPGS